MNDFALRNDDGDEFIGLCYVDGYHIGDRLLEGVMFEIRLGEGASLLICEGVHSSCEQYIRQFSAEKLQVWREKAVDYMVRDGTAYSDDEQAIHWGEE